MATFELGYPPSAYRSDLPGYHGTSLQDFFTAFPDDDACLEYLFNLRHRGDPRCPRCGKNGRWRRHSWQKHYFHPCGGIVSPMTGLVFSRSHIPLQLWFYAMLHFANSPESIATPFLARQLGISEPTAFRVATRIRYHLAAIDEGQRLGAVDGIVIARLTKVLRIVNKQINSQNSAMVLLLSDGARVDATVVVKPRLVSLRPVIARKCHPAARIVTDCYWTWRALSSYGSKRPVAEFIPDFYFAKPPEENRIHGFLQYFHLSFSNQFRGVSIGNSWLYFKEYEFRYNRRAMSGTTFWDMVGEFPLLDSSALERLKRSSFVGLSG